jgi:peptide/nickel transport system permease protein
VVSRLTDNQAPGGVADVSGPAEGGTLQRYIAGRLLLLVPTLIGVSLIIFTIMRVLPGDVTYVVLGGGQGVSAEQIAQYRHEIGLDDPLAVQYAKWASGVARLDFGKSLLTKTSISTELKNRLPVTMQLAIGAVLISLMIAIPVGVLSAVYQDRWPDYIFRVFSILGIALPIFWIQSLVRNLILPKYFHWLPPPGFVDLWVDPLGNSSGCGCRPAARLRPVGDRLAAGALHDARRAARGLHPHRPRQGLRERG